MVLCKGPLYIPEKNNNKKTDDFGLFTLSAQ